MATAPPRGRPNNAGAIGMHVQGLREAKSAFQALPQIARDAYLHATEMTLMEIRRGAQGRILSSPSVNTRRLHDHVNYTLNRKSGFGRVGVTSGSSRIIVPSVAGKTRSVRVKGVVVPGRGGSALKSAGARIDRPSRRAHFVEFGTKFMPAEPFMVPATTAQKSPYLERIRAAGREIERGVASAANMGRGQL